MSNMNDLPQDVAQQAAARPELTTAGYRFTLDRPGAEPLVMVSGVGGENSPGVRFDPLVLRDEAEAALADLKDEHDERGIDIDILSAQLAEANRKAAAWEESAAFHHRNEEFWEGLMRKIGLAVANHDIGVHVADDNTWNPEPLALKVVESIEKAYTPGNRFQRALRILITGK